MARRRKALLITYTMSDPYAVGVFFRALRIAKELAGRGWDCTVYNYGEIPNDPKVAEARGHCQLVRFDSDDSERDFDLILRDFKRIAPQVVIFGEYPMFYLEPLLRAACALVRPPVLMLDQYYSEWAGRIFPNLDAYVMYGVRSLWPDHLTHPSNRIIPPFIDRVTPRDELPVPAELRALPWISIVGFDPRVLHAGAELAAKLEDVVAISMSADPAAAERAFAEAGVRRFVALPLQHDANYFGLIAASKAVVLANGFMQICEAVALTCPALVINRGIGLAAWMLHAPFRPYAHFAELSPDGGVEQVRSWLRESPFSDELRAALQVQRGGVGKLADIVDEIFERPSLEARKNRRAARWRQIRSWFFPAREAKVKVNETA